MTVVWSDPDWRSATVGWATDQLERHGLRVSGEVEQSHIRPWSTVFRAPTAAGPFWCKANGPGPAFEGRLLAAFARLGIDGAMLPMAVDDDRALILLPDGGMTLRATRPDGDGDHDLGAWARILDGYARLQRATAPHVDALLALGVPDLRPERSVEILRAFVDDDAIWARADPEDLTATDAARRRLPALLPRIARLADALGAAGIPPTIQHDDLHGGNILVGPAGDRIFDWGDASVAHPFATLTTTFNSIEHHAGFDQHGPKLTALRDGYLVTWTDVAPMDVLAAASDQARILGAISRAASWERSFRNLEPDEMDGHGGATAAWLAEFVERVERWLVDRSG